MLRPDADAEEFKEIRVACLPEVVLAYNTVLDFSSRYLSRDLLLRSMNMAALIATKDSELATCFVAADRMPELVDSFAYLSKSIIQAEDRGAKGGKSKKKRNGETLDLWTVRASVPQA
jgi:nuclear pore complex protein Nup107